MLRYHHLGIPTTETRPGERYLAEWAMHVSGYETSPYRIEWMRFEEDCPLPGLVQTVPHVAFEVDDLEAALEGKEILIEPNSTRYSNDFDYFHDSEQRVAEAFAADRQLLEAHGYSLRVDLNQRGYIRALVGLDESTTKVEWAHERVLFWGFSVAQSGSHRAVSRVRFAPVALPSLPGDNHHHDVHVHTIAEWYFGSPLDIFAPRKAYGGPLQMLFDIS